MSKIILIHGFGIGITAPFLRRGFGESAGFAAFNEMIVGGEAAVFYWGIKKQVSPWKILNPIFWLNLYEDEKILSQATATHRQLHDFLFYEQPEIIVSHSMGCFLLNEYLKQNSLPSSVKRIFFVQSDLSRRAKLNTNLPIINIYCFWDSTLLLSAIYNHERRGGLLPIKGVSVKNIFTPLWRLPNPHNNILHCPRLVKFIVEYKS